MSEYDFSLFGRTIASGDTYTGEFIKKWCEHHMATGKTTGDPYYEAHTIYNNHWILSDYKPNPKVYYYPAFGTARVGYILKRDKKKSPVNKLKQEERG